MHLVLFTIVFFVFFLCKIYLRKTVIHKIALSLEVNLADFLILGFSGPEISSVPKLEHIPELSQENVTHKACVVYVEHVGLDGAR